MATQSLQVIQQNTAMKLTIAEYGLTLADVWQPKPYDHELENRQLSCLLDWIRAYQAWPNRSNMERHGYEYPPVEPDLDPDTDWLRFEKWMNHQPVAWNFVREFGQILDPVDASDEQVHAELERVARLLGERSVVVGWQDAVPERLVLTYLRRVLAKEEFEITSAGSQWHMEGCDGFCPGCFQRPWCDNGRESCWLEDEDAGKMAIPEETKPYAKGLVMSLAELRNRDAGIV